MSLQVEKLEKNMAKLTIEVPAEELEAAIEDAKKQTVSTLIDMKVLPKTMSAGYENWWRVGVAEVSTEPEVQAARKAIEDHLYEARHY